MDEVLDNSAWASLTGPHAAIARSAGRVRCYPRDMSLFGAMPADAEDDDWDAMRELVGGGNTVLLTGDSVSHPASWQRTRVLRGYQLVSSPALVGAHAPQVVVLGDEHASQMQDLVRRTEPGPFQTRTHQLGTFLGMFERDELVAMAGERLRPPSLSELSAVCTAQSHRGRGLGTRLVSSLLAVMQDRGDAPFLHVAATVPNAVAALSRHGLRHPSGGGVRGGAGALTPRSLTRTAGAGGCDARLERLGGCRSDMLDQKRHGHLTGDHVLCDRGQRQVVVPGVAAEQRERLTHVHLSHMGDDTLCLFEEHTANGASSFMH